MYNHRFVKPIWSSIFDIKFFLSGLLLFLLAGCTAAPVTLCPGAEKIIVEKSPPPIHYKLIGPVQAQHRRGCGGYGANGTYEGAINQTKNNALAMGANYVQIHIITPPHSSGICFVNAWVVSVPHIGKFLKIRSLPKIHKALPIRVLRKKYVSSRHCWTTSL